MALAAKLLNVPATVVLPVGVPLTKLTAIQHHGAEVLLQGVAYDDAHAFALKLGTERGLAYVHAFEDPDVIAGQGTLGLELLEDVPDLDALVVPVGGGGLIAGAATAARHLRPDLKIFGVQAAGSPVPRRVIQERSARDGRGTNNCRRHCRESSQRAHVCRDPGPRRRPGDRRG